MTTLEKTKLSPIAEVLEDAKAGRMFILVDDEDRENEGDLIIPASHANAEAINFMAIHGRGLICLAMTGERIDELRLPLMPRSNSSRFDTAFTVSIEAREGVETGISAKDRAKTISVAIDQKKGAHDLTTPGHVFPLVARDGGVLVRAGHTEAAVDIARLAGLYPAGVICEIMKHDGTMARLPDLLPFAETHGLKIATIADLIAYRLKRDKLVSRVMESEFENDILGKCRMIVYKSLIDQTEHIALVKGDISKTEPTLVRMHAFHIMSDFLSEKSTNRAGVFDKAMKKIAENGSGVMVVLREPRKDSVSAAINPKASPQSAQNLRDYGIGAQILLDLGIHKMTLLSNSHRHVIGLEGYDLEITGFREL